LTLALPDRTRARVNRRGPAGAKASRTSYAASNRARRPESAMRPPPRPQRGLSSVDLPPGVATRPRRTLPLLNRVRIKRTSLATTAKPTLRRGATRATVAAAGIAILAAVAVTALGGQSAPRRLEGSTSNAAVTADQTDPLGDVLRPAIAAISTDLDALARAVPSVPSTSHPPRSLSRSHSSQQHHGAIRTHTTAVGGSNPATESRVAIDPGAQTQIQSSPTVGPAPETQKVPSTAANTTSHTTAGSQTPATNGSQPAGATQSSPLGGLGSCVSGCT